MPKYRVEVSLGRAETEVEAPDADAAIDAAIAEWDDEAFELICAGTFTADVIEGEGGDSGS